MKELQIHHIPIQDLKPAEYNPRKWDAQMEQKLKESITRFGLVDPFIANGNPKRKNILIGGHFRWHIAKKMKIKSVPVVFVDIADIEKEKELNLRLNRNTGEWDLELLKNFEIDSLLDIGFNDEDLSSIWDDVLQTEDDQFDTEKALEENKAPISQEGDIYQLGRHTLVCGDSTDPEVVKKLVGKQKIDMVYSDSPYNINLDYNGGVGKKKSYGAKQTNDNKEDHEFQEFLKQTMENALSVSSNNLHMFYWCDENYIGMIQSLFEELGLTNRRVCMWIKNNQNATPQIAFNKVYEPCIYATLGKPYLDTNLNRFNEILNKEIDTGNRAMDDILDLFNIWLAKRLPTTEYKHPTEKPVTLHEKPLRRCTKPGDTVLDLFGGSGSTLIACEQMKRTCFMVELEPIFIDIIIQRYEKLTGNKAKKLN